VPRVLVRVKHLAPDALLQGGPADPAKAQFYRRAGLTLPIGYESVVDVDVPQVATLQADARVEVEPFAGEAAGYPRKLRAGDLLSAPELAARRAGAGDAP
jgi:hypothetical protein